VTENLEKLYRGLATVTGSRGIVDSSKPPGYALMLSRVPGIDLRVVHLVRDSRAVAYSWLRKKLKHEIDGQKIYMDPRYPFRVGLDWMRVNILSELLRQRANLKYLFVRYEDFVAQPRTTLERIGAFVAEDFSRLPFTGDRTVELHDQHFSFGNPMQYEHGRIEIRSDDEWRTNMRPADQRVVFAVTWPLLVRYGYTWPSTAASKSAPITDAIG
jgi:hypothetical protein